MYYWKCCCFIHLVILVQVMHHAIRKAQANPDAYQRTLENSKLQRLTKNVLEVTNLHSMSNFNFIFFRHVVNGVTIIFTSMYDKYEARTQAVRNLHILISFVIFDISILLVYRLVLLTNIDCF